MVRQHQKGGGPAGPKVVAAFGGRLCRRVVFQGAKKGSEGSKGSEGKVDGAFGPEGCIEGLCSLRSGGDSPIGLKVVDCPLGNDYEVGVTGIPFVSTVLHEVMLKPSSSGRWESCRGLPSRANI